MEKSELRKLIMNKRKNLKLEDKTNMDFCIKSSLLNSNYYKQSKDIFIYVSYNKEVDTKDLINCMLKDNKRIYIPRTKDDNQMDAVRIYSLNNLKKDKYGILQPNDFEDIIEPEKLDLIIVPGLAFDREKNRLGYGGGYYDRYFKKIKNNIVKKIALSYNFQIVQSVPVEKNDIRMDVIITENDTMI